MIAPFQGGCACKAVRYEVASEPIAFALCHCRACQYASGGEPASVVVGSQGGVEATMAMMGKSGKLSNAQPNRHKMNRDRS